MKRFACWKRAFTSTPIPPRTCVSFTPGLFMRGHGNTTGPSRFTTGFQIVALGCGRWPLKLILPRAITRARCDWKDLLRQQEEKTRVEWTQKSTLWKEL